jgi:AcrR family transcriptional regulator
MGLGKLTATGLTAGAAEASGQAAASPFHSALIDLCFERGLANLTVADLCRRSGLRRASFEDRYASLAECFAEVAGAELSRFHRRALAARAGLAEWRDRLRATTYAFYRYLEEDERLRRFLLVEARLAGERPALLLAAELETLYDVIDEGRTEPAAPPTLTRATAESLGGAIFTHLYVAAANGRPLPPEADAVPVMMYAAVLPYLGVHAAASELQVAPPPQSQTAPLP